jgi:hypothetical protein
MNGATGRKSTQRRAKACGLARGGRRQCVRCSEGDGVVPRQCPFRAGRSPDWIKVKNPMHPSIERVKEAFA